MLHQKTPYQSILLWTVVIVLVINIAFFSYTIVGIKEDYGSMSAEIGALRSDILERQNEILALKSEIYLLNQQLVGISYDFGTISNRVNQIDKDYEMQISRLDQKIGDIQVESETFSGVIADMIDATVSVNTDVGQGSGAIISSEGLVVTNYHVLVNARRASVTTYDGEVYGVKLIGYDEANDIALLQIVSSEKFNYFRFGDSDRLRAGQKVVALGNPAGLSFTATEGIVSSPSRRASDGFDYIQTDVTLNPGNSGGPLINSAGELVGIANFKVAGYQGLGFAIPSNRVEEVVDGILNSGT